MVRPGLVLAIATTTTYEYTMISHGNQMNGGLYYYIGSGTVYILHEANFCKAWITGPIFLLLYNRKH